jgi:hypothetical protein
MKQRRIGGTGRIGKLNLNTERNGGEENGPLFNRRRRTWTEKMALREDSEEKASMTFDDGHKNDGKIKRWGYFLELRLFYNLLMNESPKLKILLGVIHYIILSNRFC